MKYVSVFFILCLACHLSTPVESTLEEDLQEILNLIDIKPIKELVARYFNDQQFQYFNEYFQSVATALMEIPEVIEAFEYIENFLKRKIRLDEFPKTFCGSNRSNSVFDWPKFSAEFYAYYPEQLVRSHIATKVAQNGTFAELWTHVTAVGAAYNRVMSYPASQVVIAQLEAIGVNTTEIDQFIRTQLDWVNVNATTPKYESAIYGPSN